MRSHDALAACVAGILVLGGCRVVQDLVGSSPRLRFSHREHALPDLDCTTCHAVHDESPRAGHAACVACHEIGASPDETCATCHVDGRVSAEPPPATDLRFSHRLHAARDVSCERCHDDVAHSRRLGDPAFHPTMEKCLDCHRTLGGDAVACATCHTRWTTATRPASHDGRWIAHHGEASRGEETRCAVCHAVADCVRCHQDMAPRDHGEFWLRRGHGLASRWDRERCAACHREDACIECHRMTPPANHGAGWGSPTYRHFPLEDTSCAVCHDQAHPNGLPPS
jgi:hypothetical protein